MNQIVITCDEQGNPTGTADIFAAHTGEGKLHRAFSVFVMHKDRPEMLIQRRSAKKMLWAGIWANTCCSHPKQGESAMDAGKRRLREEMGFTCDLKEMDSFVYKANDPQGKGLEYEYDTILLGHIDDSVAIKANPDEVMEWKWVPVQTLLKDMEIRKDAYAPWFHIGIQKVLPTS